MVIPLSPTDIFYRLLAESDGNLQNALQHASHTIYELSGSVSCGYMRAKREEDATLKPKPPYVDIPPPDEPPSAA